MDVKKISHIGVAVPSIDEYVGFYKDIMGLTLSGTETIASQNVKVAFLDVGESRIELLEPLSEKGAVAKYLAQNDGKPKIHHVAYEVENVEAALKEAAEKGAKLIDETPRIGAGGTKIAFIHPKSTAGVLTEFCEEHK